MAKTHPDPEDPFADGEPPPVAIPIDGTLDLHHFHPREVKSLLHDYLEACREEGLGQVLVIHGKGTGTLRELVHAQLRKIPWVTGFEQAGQVGGGWGATRVFILGKS